MDNKDSFLEIEAKFAADNIKLQDFMRLVKEFNPIKQLDISSWDTYFTNGTENDFLRYRESSTPELTLKKKRTKNNNFERIEVDLPIDLIRNNHKTTDTFASLLGYSENFKIYKTCFIYWLENINYVYYIVYDIDMKELNRFVEVEVNKDKVSELGVEGSKNELNKAIEKLQGLNINRNNRLKRSLFEMYRK